MHPNAELIQRFYHAFNLRDADAMAACYGADVVFEDPAFGELHGAEVAAMWRMLCARASDLQVDATDIQAGDTHGSARWEARYPFTQTGRRVHNIVDARFGFHDGLIVEHRDVFDLWRWTRQALGVPGWLLGWSDFMRRKVQAQARANLRRYLASTPAA